MSRLSLVPFVNKYDGKCKTCMVTEITRPPFPSVAKESKLLNLIHSDL